MNGPSDYVGRSPLFGVFSQRLHLLVEAPSSGSSNLPTSDGLSNGSPDQIQPYVSQMPVFCTHQHPIGTLGYRIVESTSLIASTVERQSEESVCIPDG